MAMNGNTLGDELKAAVMAEVNKLTQSSDPAAAATHQTNMWRAIGNAIVTHIKNNATIDPLTVSNTIAGDPPHTHAPAATQSATGKIK